MSADRSRRIRNAFGSADSYDAHATAQAASAGRLAALVASHGVQKGCAVLDAGCGTGALASHLLASGLPGRYVLADIAPEMLCRAKARLSEIASSPMAVAMDIARPVLKPGFGLVASNMALHWVENMPSAVSALWDLLAPGGLLAVAVPGQETFSAWRQAHEDLGLSCGLQDFPSAASLAAMFPATPLVVEERHPLSLKRALDLPRHLKAVGGFVPRPGHAPLSASAFRAVLARLDANRPTPEAMGYHVLYALASKP